jgi:hypothetical protein
MKRTSEFASNASVGRLRWGRNSPRTESMSAPNTRNVRVIVRDARQRILNKEPDPLHHMEWSRLTEAQGTPAPLACRCRERRSMIRHYKGVKMTLTLSTIGQDTVKELQSIDSPQGPSPIVVAPRQPATGCFSRSDEDAMTASAARFSVLLDDPEIGSWANEIGRRYQTSPLRALGLLAQALSREDAQ